MGCGIESELFILLIYMIGVSVVYGPPKEEIGGCHSFFMVLGFIGKGERNLWSCWSVTGVEVMG